MDTFSLLQHYWWLLISLLGAFLVFLLFVQGGQGLLRRLGRTEDERAALVEALGSKWELTFTTLVTFGGAFFASFPLFYSTSFGGAFYMWTALLLVFVVQAVAYEYRRKPGNLFGERTYDLFLLVNGIAGPLLLGVLVGTFFTGAHFTVRPLNLVGEGGSRIISQWTTPWHGLEALADPRNLLLGASLTALAGMLACQYFMNCLDDARLRARARRAMRPLALLFLALFASFLAGLLTADGPHAAPDGSIVRVPYKYLRNLLQMPVAGGLLALGVLAVAWSILRGWRGDRRAFRFGGCGTVLTVLALLLCAGWNDTAYYPSLAEPGSSLTIRNSSSSEFTLKVMSVVSLLIPVILLYVRRVWRALGSKRPGPRRDSPAR